MKEATLTSAHVAESFQPVINWKAVRNNVGVIARKFITLIRHEATPWTLAAIATMLMCCGFALGCDMLYKWSGAAVVFPFSWALIREFKNYNPDEL